jgi:phospholipid-binding lipoprotein MlaA
MPAATFIIASLAALEPPRRPIDRSLAFLQTNWSLSAAPVALAAADQPQRPIVGPGQIEVLAPTAPAVPDKKKGEVKVLPAETADPLDDQLEDPAAEQAVPGTEAGDTAGAATPAPDAAATDPLEEELARSIRPDSDPLEGFNRISFAVSMAIDKAILRPVALTYVKIAPKPLRDGMRNVLAHWGAPIIAANDLLQLKPKRAIRTIARFLINTLLGLGGLFDVAREKKFNLPHHGNSFSNTLGFYGVKPGPYIYLPVLGPTTLRDQANRVQNYVPGIDTPYFRNGRGTVFGYLLGLEDRANNDQELKALLDDSVDPYASFRTTWLQDRQGEIERLKAPDGKEPGSVEANPLDDALADPAAPASPSAPGAAEPETVTPAP